MKGVLQAHVDVCFHRRRCTLAAPVPRATRRGRPAASDDLVGIVRQPAGEEGAEEVGEIAAIAGELEPDSPGSGAARA